MESVDYIQHERGDKFRVSDPQSEGRGFGKVHVKLLRAVRSRAGNGGRITGPLGSALHREGGLALAVNVWVGAVVFSWSRAHGEILRGRADLPAAGEAEAVTGGFVRDVATEHVWETVAGGGKKV